MWPPSFKFYIALCSLTDGGVHDITLQQLTLINLLFQTKSATCNRKYQIFVERYKKVPHGVPSTTLKRPGP